METLVCKQVYIEPRQDELLKQWTAKTGMSETDIIRQAIDQWLEDEGARRQRALAAWKEARAFIEARVAQGPVPGKRTWTRDELYAVIEDVRFVNPFAPDFDATQWGL